MKKNVLVESTKSKFQVLAKKPANVLKRIQGVLSDFGSNRNGRIYPRELWENVINSDYVKEMINSHGLVGELDHPEERLEISLQEVSHVINDMWIEGDQVMGIIDILPTPNGKIVNELLDYGTDIGISSRGAGSVGPDNVVDPDYQFITFDFVARPSCEAARLNTILEGVQVDIANNSVDKVNSILESYKSGLKESEDSNKEAFIAYCKDKIKDLGTVEVETEDWDSDEEDAKKKVNIRVDLINAEGNYVLNNEDCMNELDTDGEGGVYYFPKTEEILFTGPMDNWNDNINKLDFQAISKTCYDNVLEYWDDLNMDEEMDLEGIIKDSDEKISKELRLPKPLKYNVIHRLGGSDVEVYIPGKGTVAQTTTMKGDQHIQDHFDIDGLWQVNTYDKKGNFLKYDYVDGWKNMVKLVLSQIGESDNLKEAAMSDQDVYKVVLNWYKDQIEAGKMTLNQCYELLSDKAKVSLNKLVDQSKIRESVMNDTLKGLLKEAESLNSKQVGLWVNGKVYWEGDESDVDDLLIADVADQASEEDGKTYDMDEVDIKPLEESLKEAFDLDTALEDVTEWAESIYKGSEINSDTIGSLLRSHEALKDKYTDKQKERIVKWFEDQERMLMPMEESSKEPIKEAEGEEYRPNGVIDDIKRRGTGDLDVESPLELNTGVIPVLDTNTYGRDEYWYDYNIEDDKKFVEWQDDCIIRYGTPIVEEYIKSVLPSASCEGQKVYHPRYYNFSGDELEFKVSFDPKEYLALEKAAVEDPEFKEYLKDNYKSYDGFISYLADNLDEFYQQDGWKRFCQVIMFNLRNEDFDKTNEDFWTDIYEDDGIFEFATLNDEE